MGTTELIFVCCAIIIANIVSFGSLSIILRRGKAEHTDIPYYDRFEHTWKYEIEGNKECGCLEYVLSEFIQGGLIYHFYVNNNLDHEHTFEAVLEAVIREYKTFSIHGYEHEYSEQEIKMLSSLVEKLKEKESKESEA